VEIRIPVTQDENDPYHQVIGRKPTQSLPWHINICRQRIREHGQEFSALSPTGIKQFHVPMKFAQFYAGKSHNFESDPEVTDFAIGYRSAARTRKADAFLALAEIEKINDFQKSAALEQAASLSRKEAGPIVEQIPVEVVKKTAQMQHLLIQGKAPEVISQFANEDITQWPFWKRGDGYRNRGRAYYITKDGAKAETDLSKALPWTSDPGARDAVLLMLAQNRERNLGDDARAYEAFDAIVSGRERIGDADQFSALQGIARILTKRGQFEEALKTLDRANPDKLEGGWKTNILKSIEEVNEARRGVPK
jgi:tetratricopeptide (TPR) repeat protein